MVGWHHRLNGYEFEQALEDGDGQGSLVCCSPWGCKESDTTEQLNFRKNLERGYCFAWKSLASVQVCVAKSLHHLFLIITTNSFKFKY